MDEYRIIDDAAAEKKYGFRMRETIRRISQRDEGKKLLSGWSVYLCKGVADNKAPSSKEFQCIVEASGASWLSTNQQLKAASPSTLLIVTGLTNAESQLKPKTVNQARSNGAVVRSFKDLFDCIMTQAIDW